MGVLDAVFDVFTSIVTWFSDTMPSIQSLFYTTGADGGLTFLGVLAVAGLGIGVVFLLIGVISNFLHFRG